MQALLWEGGVRGDRFFTTVPADACTWLKSAIWLRRGQQMPAGEGVEGTVVRWIDTSEWGLV